MQHNIIIMFFFISKIYYILVQFRLAKLWSDIHNGSVIVVFLSSTINPFIYGLWGKQFRAGMKSAFLVGCVGSASRNRLATGHGIGG